jgi:hypothetical protein
MWKTLKRWFWINRAKRQLEVYGFTEENAPGYAAALYQTYVIESGDEGTPEDIVNEEMTCD